jgi:hypothetical protein
MAEKQKTSAAKQQESRKDRNYRQEQSTQETLPHFLTNILALQRVAGNRAVSRLLQAKFQVSQPGDVYEQEADAMADKVMRMPSVETSPLGRSTPQRKCTQCEEEEKEQGKTILRKENSYASPSFAPPVVNHLLNTSTGKSLDPGTRSFMESRFNFDFSKVKIHDNDLAAASASTMSALAYTSGNNIVFNKGQYSPATISGKKLLAHELTHVVQQGQGLKGKVQRAPWGVCPPGEPLSATNPFVYGAAELLAIAHYKSRNSGHVVITNKELEIGVTLTGLPAREQKIFDQIREGFHRDKSPQKRRWIASPDNVTERPEATGEALEAGIQFVQQLLQPDIMDLTSLEIYDVTTTKQRSKKLNKILTTTYVPRLKALTGLEWKAGKSLAPMIPFIVPLLPSKDKVICFGATDFDTYPGVIAYEGLKYDISKLKKTEEKEKPKEGEKPKENEKPKEGEKPKEAEKAKGGAYNFGFGISILSSGAGVGNAGVGISIMSDGVSVGTLSGGIVYNSQGAAIGVVGGGMSKDSMSAGAGVAGLGKSEGNLGASAGTANVGTSKDNTMASAGTAGKGDTEGKMAAQAGKAGNASNADNQGDKGDTTQEAMSQAAKIEDALKNASPQQRKLLEKMAQKQGGSYQTSSPEWVNDFLQSTKNITDADVDAIANSTTGNAQNDLPKIRQGAQQAAGKGAGADKAGGADGKGDKDAGTQKAKADDGGTAGTDDTYKRLNDTSRKKISEAPGPVAALFKSFAAGQKDDLVLTDDIVTKFFEAVPSDLKQEEADKLADGMVSSKGMTPDQVIAELKKSIEQARKSKDAPDSQGGKPSAATADVDSTKSHDEIIAELKALAAKSESEGRYKLMVPKAASISDLNKKITGTTLKTFVLWKTEKGVGTAGYIIAQLPPKTDISKLKSGSQITVEITYTSEFVDKNGNIHNVNFGKTMTITK